MTRCASEMPRYKSGPYKTTRRYDRHPSKAKRLFKLVEYKGQEDLWKIAPITTGPVSDKAVPLRFLDARLWSFILEWLV